MVKAWRKYLKACFIFAMDTAVTKRLPVRSGEKKNADFQGAEAYAFNEWKTLHLQKQFPQQIWSQCLIPRMPSNPCAIKTCAPSKPVCH